MKCYDYIIIFLLMDNNKENLKFTYSFSIFYSIYKHFTYINFKVI